MSDADWEVTDEECLAMVLPLPRSAASAAADDAARGSASGTGPSTAPALGHGGGDEGCPDITAEEEEAAENLPETEAAPRGPHGGTSGSGFVASPPKEKGRCACGAAAVLDFASAFGVVVCIGCKRQRQWEVS